ncbi:MAG TPA: hypothetical protein VFB19_16685 [Mycobacterium sp.]|nr:hypothetical protein [Mycobacterium sp.]
MEAQRHRHGPISRFVAGSAHAESFIIIAIVTILVTRLYLKLTGYPQVGGGNLHIAHTLYGEALMMLALLIGWLLLGGGARNLAVVLGGIGFGLVLDEVGKFVTKDNDYFYGPSAEIMYVLVVVVLVGTRALRAVHPLTAQECLASAAVIAADGLARGLGDHRRESGLRLVALARRDGADPDESDHVRALLLSARRASDRLYAIRTWALRLVPGFFESPKWVPIIGWILVAAAFASLFFHTLGVALGGYFYHDALVKFHLAGSNADNVILLVGAVLTLAMALPAAIALRHSDGIWPVRWLRDAALLFTLLSALVHFATEGFAALINLAIGLAAMALLGYQLSLRERADVPLDSKGESLQRIPDASSDAR